MIETYTQAVEVLAKRSNWLKSRIESAQREGRFLSHDVAEYESLDFAIELCEVAANGEKELS